MLFQGQILVFAVLDLLKDNDDPSLNKHSSVARCDITCSINHLCYGSRYSGQILNLLLYSFLLVVGLNLFAIATTIGTTISFATIHRPNLFGRQRVWGTIGFGVCAFVVSHLYQYFKTLYVYLFTYIACSVLCMICTCFIRIRSDEPERVEQTEDDKSAREKLKESSRDKNESQKDSSDMDLLYPVLKNIDVIVFLLTTLVWGMSFSALDPVRTRFLIFRFVERHKMLFISRSNLSILTTSYSTKKFCTSHSCENILKKRSFFDFFLL